MLENNKKRTDRRSGLFITTLCMAGLFAGMAAAQQPTAAQQSAIKSACRSDFMAQCSGVSPGGQAALSCLQQHSSSLSAACQTAIGALGGGKSAPAATATSPATAPATAPAATATQSAPAFTPRGEMAIVRQSCGPDFRKFCGSVALGGGRAIACLRDNLSNLSPTCQKVLTTRR
ncbi:cysteine rich repeat-containing protein [Phyllobacterium sp. LjRoot231]|uniref:cysteine rich repeat-containing protein n=1 Tax=Phyllobacterium sp. LjRoot231 TaxID=3342289 RepID=UPI003ED0BD96